jgi:hypothetical protein
MSRPIGRFHDYAAYARRSWSPTSSRRNECRQLSGKHSGQREPIADVHGLVTSAASTPIQPVDVISGTAIASVAPFARLDRV